jgi:pyruvyltransferase
LLNNYIILGWANASKREDKNFGDELSKYIIKKLSGKKIYHAPCAYRWKVPLHLVSMLFHFWRIKKETIINFIMFYITRRYVLGVGSILQYYKANGAIIWGTGIVNQKDTVENFEFRAVRGKYTRNKLLSLGYNAPEIYGDPAILLPIIYKPSMCPTTIIGIIPHVIHYNIIKSWKLSTEYKIIDLRTSNIEKVINDICSCKLILSSSLHGLIVSHAYGIEAIWCSLPEIPLIGDNVKFLDYFSSVNIQEYKPKILSKELFSSVSILTCDLSEYKHFHLPNVSLAKIQQNLLKVAPFPINIKYLK